MLLFCAFLSGQPGLLGVKYKMQKPYGQKW